MRPALPLATIVIACAHRPAPAPSWAPASATELRARAAARNDAWHTLRADVGLALELREDGATERHSFDATLLCRRPDRLRLRAVVGDRVYFDLVWMGAPRLFRSLPVEERTSRLREVLGSLAEDLRVALRMDGDGADRLEMGWTEARSSEASLVELRELRGGTLLRRSAYEPATLLRRRLEQGHGSRVERTVHYADHASGGAAALARRIVVANVRHDYWLSLDLRSAAVDAPIAEVLWAP